MRGFSNSDKEKIMAIILAGDTHGMTDMDKLTDYFEGFEGLGVYTEKDYLIILGDVGILWDGGTGDKKVRSTLESFPVTTLWIDGNHDNFDLLEKYETNMWHGGKAHFITDKIIHLCRGQVFDIEGKKFFTFGGGNSIDRIYRNEGLNWWSREMPSNEEYEEGLDNLEKAENKVDYILTHTCPEMVAKKLVAYMYPGEEVLQRYLDRIAEYTEFEEWYFGHWHKDRTVGKYRCLYNDIVEIM